MDFKRLQQLKDFADISIEIDVLLKQLFEKSEKLEEIFTDMLSITSSFTGADILELANDINECEVLKNALYVTSILSTSKKEKSSSLELSKLVKKIDTKEKGKKLNKKI